MTPDESLGQILLDTVPLVMRSIRRQLRGQRGADLSIPQFRTLMYLNHHSGDSLSDLACHIGQSLPAMSTLVDGLVKRELVERRVDSRDRRRVDLGLSAAGKTLLEQSQKAAKDHLDGLLSPLTAEVRSGIVRAMDALKSIFITDDAAGPWPPPCQDPP